MSDVLADRIERMERFVKRMNEVERDLTSPYVRPKDAATLILVDRGGRVPKVLLGKRHHGARRRRTHERPVHEQRRARREPMRKR